MIWHSNPYALVLIVCSLVTGGVALYAWRHRAANGAAPAVILLGATIWSLGYGVATGVYDLPGRILWAKVQHIGIAMMPASVLAFTLRYTGYTRWLTRRNIALAAVVPLVGALLAWTNEAHGLIWAQVQLEIVNSVAVLDIEYGPYFWFYAVYNHLMIAFCAILLLQTFFRSSHLQRRQAGIMVIGMLCPAAANLLYLAGWNPFPHLDLTPFGYSLSGLILTWGLFRYRLFDIVPVARHKVLEDISDGVVVLDAWARIVDANPAALRVIRRPASEVIGQPAEQIFSGRPDLVERFRDVHEARAQIAVGEGEAQRYFDLHISPLYGRRGTFTGRVIVLHDITDRKRHEEALRQSMIELEARNQELDAFAHTVAHDLKSPLANAFGYAEALAMYYSTLSDEEMRESLRVIVQSVHRMSNIVDELLLLAGVRQMAVASKPLDMASIVAGTRQRLADMIERYHAQIIWPDTSAWPAALGHDSWVEEVWVNYISNAIKYGGRPPHVELGATMQSDGQVCFWVRDNGVGLSPEAKTRLFIPFTRLGQVHAEGHGLGLSIVRRIVEKLGGQVGVESEVDQGSVFSFTLPGESSPT